MRPGKCRGCCGPPTPRWPPPAGARLLLPTPRSGSGSRAAREILVHGAVRVVIVHQDDIAGAASRLSRSPISVAAPSSRIQVVLRRKYSTADDRVREHHRARNTCRQGARSRQIPCAMARLTIGSSHRSRAGTNGNSPSADPQVAHSRATPKNTSSRPPPPTTARPAKPATAPLEPAPATPPRNSPRWSATPAHSRLSGTAP